MAKKVTFQIIIPERSAQDGLSLSPDVRKLSGFNACSASSPLCPAIHVYRVEFADSREDSQTAYVLLSGSEIDHDPANYFFTRFAVSRAVSSGCEGGADPEAGHSAQWIDRFVYQGSLLGHPSDRSLKYSQLFGDNI